MAHWRPLIRNEVVKMLRKRRFLVVVLILAVLIPIFTYAHYTSSKTAEQQLGTQDWHALLQQQIIDEQNRLGSSRLPATYRQSIQAEIQQQQYYLNHNVNPAAPGAATFMREFASETIALFLPMLIIVIGVDMVSSEWADGTIKLLLTRPVRRWQVLASKYIALVLLISLFVMIAGVLSCAISGIAFGYGSWTLPIFVGFSAPDATVQTVIHSVPQWQYIIMSFGLAWYVCLAMGTISFLVSVLMRSGAAGMGIMMAALIAGNLLVQLASSWPTIKYVAFVNLQLTDYLTGTAPPVAGMTLPFSLGVLAAWAAASLAAAFWVFTRRDVLA